MARLVRLVERHSHRQRQIVEAVRGQIVSGQLAPGARVPSINELAAAHQASTKTALTALTYLQEHGFITSRRGSGSFVSETPPHLSQFALVFQDAPKRDGSWSQFFMAWKREAKRLVAPGCEGSRCGRRFSFIYLDLHVAGTPAERELQSAMEADLFAGLIFPDYPSFLHGAEILADRRTPKVCVAQQPKEGFTTLVLDNALPEKALNCLAGHGRRRAAFLVPSFLDSDSPILATDYLVRLAADCGLTSYRHWVQGIDITSPRWAANWTEFLCRCGPERPDALFISDDNLVPSATQGLLNAGIRVPDDIEVVAHCNFPYPTPSLVPARRIGFDVRQLLHLSVDTIERQRRGEAVPDTLCVHSHFDDELPYSAPGTES